MQIHMSCLPCPSMICLGLATASKALQPRSVASAGETCRTRWCRPWGPAGTLPALPAPPAASPSSTKVAAESLLPPVHRVCVGRAWSLPGPLLVRSADDTMPHHHNSSLKTEFYSHDGKPYCQRDFRVRGHVLVRHAFLPGLKVHMCPLALISLSNLMFPQILRGLVCAKCGQIIQEKEVRPKIPCLPLPSPLPATTLSLACHDPLPCLSLACHYPLPCLPPPSPLPATTLSLACHYPTRPIPVALPSLFPAALPSLSGSTRWQRARSTTWRVLPAVSVGGPSWYVVSVPSRQRSLLCLVSCLFFALIKLEYELMLHIAFLNVLSHCYDC